MSTPVKTYLPTLKRIRRLAEKARCNYVRKCDTDLKASVVERFNRTLKTKMYRYFTHANTRRYVDVLDDLVHTYNNTYHRSIGMAPVEVGPHNENDVRACL